MRTRQRAKQERGKKGTTMRTRNEPDRSSTGPAKWLVLILLGASPLTSHGADLLPLKLVSTIPLPGVTGRFDHFAIDPKGSRLFVAALGNNTLEVVELAAGKRVESVAGMSKPTGVLYLSDRSEVLVANGDDGTLKVLDGTSFNVKHNLGQLCDADN